MGIVNCTPDSFYDGGRFVSADDAVQQGLRLVEEGADVLDVGGESTRPGAEPVPAQEEVRRVLPVLRGLARRTKVALSIDTMKAEVAEAALAEGATWVNDVTALRHDPRLSKVVAKAGCLVVLMHMGHGGPKAMQLKPSYKDVVGEIRRFFSVRLRQFQNEGGDLRQVLIDPGFGFGKNLHHNLQLLRGLGSLSMLGRPLVVGVSRKSFLGRILADQVGPDDLPLDKIPPPEARLYASLAAQMWAAMSGATVLRVHDVRATREFIRTWKTIADAF